MNTRKQYKKHICVSAAYILTANGRVRHLSMVLNSVSGLGRFADGGYDSTLLESVGEIVRQKKIRDEYS